MPTRVDSPPASASAYGKTVDGPMRPVKDGITRTFRMVDGTSVTGKITGESTASYQVQTSMGRVRIAKNRLLQTRIRLKTTDGNTVTGLLLHQTKTHFFIRSAMGRLDVLKSQVRAFDTTTLDPTGRPIGGDQASGKFSHAIEPPVDLFFDPTAYTFNAGDRYISGLSFAYGFTDWMLASINVVQLLGLNTAGSANPNIELKFNIFANRTAERDVLTTVGLRLNYKTLNGWTRTDSRSGTTTKTTLRPGAEHSDMEFYSDTLTSFFGSTKRCNLPDPSDCSKLNYKPEFGWQTQLYLVQTVSLAQRTGGRLGLTAGGQVGTNQLVVQENKVTEQLPWRIWAGMDMDLTPRVKLMLVAWYDPDAYNYLTGDTGAGADVGFMFAATRTFRLQLHIQPLILGFFWRF